MEDDRYAQSWHRLMRSGGDPRAVVDLARQVACRFTDACAHAAEPPLSLIDLLCEMGTTGDDIDILNDVARVLFGDVIEPLCDGFDPHYNAVYLQVMARIIAFCRRLPGGRTLDAELSARGVAHSEQLVRRFENLPAHRGPMRADRSRVRTVIFLSRITIGADVAVTSVMIQCFADWLAGADMVVIGNRKNAQIFAGNRRIRMRPLEYARAGGIMERLNTWSEVLRVIDEERRRAEPGTVLVVDPDSRLSQLGVLPVASPAEYLYWNSRDSRPAHDHMRMGERVNAWLSEVTGRPVQYYPRLWLAGGALERARQFCEQLRHSGCQRIVCVNLGVGGNPKKRVGDDFESGLLRSLLGSPGTVVALDEGFGEEESARANALIRSVGSGCPSRQGCRLTADAAASFAHGVIGLRCSLEEIAALITHSDEFIGYDSACQHFSAAVGTPCVTIFCGAPSDRFVARWRAYGTGDSHWVHVADGAAADEEKWVDRVMGLRSGGGSR